LTVLENKRRVINVCVFALCACGCDWRKVRETLICRKSYQWRKSHQYLCVL